MPSKPLNLIFTGQSLIAQTPASAVAPALARVRDLLLGADAVFTNFEGSVLDRREGWLLKSPEWSSVKSPAVLEAVKAMGFNLLALSNNHAWDCGPQGVLDTLETCERLKLAHAGTGRSLEEAEAPAFLDTPHGRVALLAMASGALPESASATSAGQGHATRPGVNTLRVEPYWTVPAEEFERLRALRGRLLETPQSQAASLDFFGTRFEIGDTYAARHRILEADRLRVLGRIAAAASHADVVLVYHHQHHWEREPQQVGTWLRTFAHDCVDAGAHAFLGHGVPMLQGIEFRAGRPILFGLGNFIFHSRRTEHWRDPRNWRSVVARVRFEQGRCTSLRLEPIEVEASERVEAGDFSPPAERFPRRAQGASARAVFDDLAKLSMPFGTALAWRGDHAEAIIGES